MSFKLSMKCLILGQLQQVDLATNTNFTNVLKCFISVQFSFIRLQLLQQIFFLQLFVARQVARKISRVTPQF